MPEQDPAPDVKILRGAFMSTKQMARAAVDGRRVTFATALPGIQVVGYVVNMDDYHWLVAQVGNENEAVVSLVHKALCPLVTISEHLLAEEPESFQEDVRRIGQKFWNVCNTIHFGQTNKEKP